MDQKSYEMVKNQEKENHDQIPIVIVIGNRIGETIKIQVMTNKFFILQLFYHCFEFVFPLPSNMLSKECKTYLL